jgi:ERCC4-type nuclease
MSLSKVQEEKTLQSYPNILYIDSREPPIMMEKIAELCPIPIEAKMLQTGDYVCGDVGVERKSPNDFALSICGQEKEHNGRLFTQSERLGKEFPHHYIFVTGTLDDITIHIHRHAVLGALASVMAHGINVCFGLNNEDDFTYLLLKLLEKYGKLQMITPRKSEKPKHPEPEPEKDVFVGIVN